MVGILLLAAAILCVFAICFRLQSLHTKYLHEFEDSNLFITNDYVDEIIEQQIDSYGDSSHEFNYCYNRKNMPFGRVMSFLNFFGRSIYDEEPYLFLCKRSSRDNEFREYGCVFARTGIYISVENPNNKDRKEKEDSLPPQNKHIDFSGLVAAHRIGNSIWTVNFRPNHHFESYKLISIGSASVAAAIEKCCSSVIENQIGLKLQKGQVVEVLDQEDIERPVPENYEEKNKFDDRSKKYFDDVTRQKEKTLKAHDNHAEQAAGVQAVQPKFAAFFGEVKNLMNGARGHGYAAEYGNNTFDRMHGRQVESAAQNLNEHGRQVKHGADRLVNNVEIQTKYYKTASETIGAAFEKKHAIYLRSDGSGKMMQIEVPRDQYQDALKAMQKRIDSGQVPNVAKGEDAHDYVRRGFFAYEQSFNIARSGTIESLSVDAVAGAVCCVQATGISAVIVYAHARWSGASRVDALKNSLSAGLLVMGKGTLIYTLTMQLSRKEIANILAGKVFTADGISQGDSAIANPIYSISENMATNIKNSVIGQSAFGQKFGLDKIGGRQLIGGAVTVAVVFGPDIFRALERKISVKQLAKNSAIGAAGIAGAAIGQAAIPIPVVGAMIGGAVGGVATKGILDHFVEDDSKEMFRILKGEFIDQTMQTGLSQEEFKEVVDMTVAAKKLPKVLQKMFQSKNYRNYARDQIMIPAIETVLQNRNKITVDGYNQALLELATEQ
ncbi:MAG: hypothetical protein PUF49_03530 [Firmicutes bacterium]|nr:hypothetical protein [Bacillota bacterium]